MLLWLVGGCLLSTVSADVDKLIISCKTGSLSLVDSNGTYRPLYDLNEEISKMVRLQSLYCSFNPSKDFREGPIIPEEEDAR